MCKRSHRRHAYTYGHEPIIRASVGARNAYEINAFRHTISSQTQRQTDGSMVIDEYRARITLYSIANTATITVPPKYERDDTPLSHSGMQRWQPRVPCIVLDGELPIP